jgi:hypothetical protein
MTTALQLGLFSPRWRPTPPVEQAPEYCDQFLASHVEILASAGDAPLTLDADSWDWDARTAVGIDVEIYRNFFLLCVHRFTDGKRMAFELSNRSELNRTAIKNLLTRCVTISFNGNSYDLPVIAAALAGASLKELYTLSMSIVNEGARAEKGLPGINHVDLMMTCPAGRQSLKMIHGRLHGQFIVDLPFPPDDWLTASQMNIVTLYCLNDLVALKGLYHALRGPLEMRVALGQRWGLDLRSKSDAQVGEAVVRAGVERALGHRIAQSTTTASTFGYTVPEWIRFESQQLRTLMTRLNEAQFSVDAFGNITPPLWLKTHTETLGNSIYTMGIGGLHSTEEHRALRSNTDHQLVDVDVASQYPNLILRLGLYPAATGPEFLQVYGDIVKERLAAKAAGDKVRMDGGRVAVNGVYGKLGSSYSFLYAPHMLVATTLTGQLSILMLIEMAEEAGIPVVSANTDGVVFLCPRALETQFEMILARWEEDVGMVLERTRYTALWSSSVNTYIALKEDGKVKRKGWIANPWADGDQRVALTKNPQMCVCSDAVMRWLTEEVPIDETVYNCSDPRAFVTLIKVTGGAVWRGHALGRAARFYWSANGEAIRYGSAGHLNGKKVPKTDGARPLPEMTEDLPPDLDYVRYCEEAIRLARDLGVQT